MRSERHTQDEKTVFLRGLVVRTDGVLSVDVSGGQHSHQMTALADANCLVEVPVGVGVVLAGDEVDVVMFGARETRTRKEVLGG